MQYTVTTSAKGQITIPKEIRKKYKITGKIPILIRDENGEIKLKIAKIVEDNDIELRENGITFKKGINPQELIDAIREIDG
jgi:AbrB family looped-hinge helix DNA binding protein